MRIAVFGAEAEHGLSAIRNADPLLLLLAPTVGGLLLGGPIGMVAGQRRVNQGSTSTCTPSVRWAVMLYMPTCSSSSTSSRSQIHGRCI